jgi:hypothetical protein
MASVYDKHFILAAYLHRFIIGLPDMQLETLEKMEQQASTFYDKVGKEEFRKYASVTPEAIKEFKQYA